MRSVEDKEILCRLIVSKDSPCLSSIYVMCLISGERSVIQQFTFK